MNTNNIEELNQEQLSNVFGGHEEQGFWYKVGKFFAEQANANESINNTYGNTNQNNYW